MIRTTLLLGLFSALASLSPMAPVEGGAQWATGSLSQAEKDGKLTVKFKVDRDDFEELDVKVAIDVTEGTSGNTKAHTLAEAINAKYGAKGLSAVANANTLSIVSTKDGKGVTTVPKADDKTGQKTAFSRQSNPGADDIQPFSARPLDPETIFVTFTGWPTGVAHDGGRSEYTVGTAQATAVYSPTEGENMVKVMKALRSQLADGGVVVSHIAPHTLQIRLKWAADEWIQVGTNDQGSDWFTSGWDD